MVTANCLIRSSSSFSDGVLGKFSSTGTPSGITSWSGRNNRRPFSVVIDEELIIVASEWERPKREVSSNEVEFFGKFSTIIRLSCFTKSSNDGRDVGSSYKVLKWGFHVLIGTYQAAHKRRLQHLQWGVWRTMGCKSNIVETKFTRSIEPGIMISVDPGNHLAEDNSKGIDVSLFVVEQLV